jgi:uncharacterized protein YndB with AHSA1/START domain
VGLETVLKIGIGIAAALACLVAAVWIVGSLLPQAHKVSARIHLDQPLDKVWAAITDYGAIPTWWPDQVTAEKQVLPGGKEIWIAGDKHGQKIGFETAEEDRPKRLVRRILDEGLPFGGTWTFDLVPSGSGTDLTVAEDGFVRPAFFRFVSRFVLGHTATLDSFLGSLKKHLDGR